MSENLPDSFERSLETIANAIEELLKIEMLKSYPNAALTPWTIKRGKVIWGRK